MLAHIKTIPESFMENYCLIDLRMKIHIKCVEKIKSMFSRIVAAVNTNEMTLCKKRNLTTQSKSQFTQLHQRRGQHYKKRSKMPSSHKIRKYSVGLKAQKPSTLYLSTKKNGYMAISKSQLPNSQAIKVSLENYLKYMQISYLDIPLMVENHQPGSFTYTC